MSHSEELSATLRQDYGFDDPAVVFGRPLSASLDDTLNTISVKAPLAMLNKHGLIAGATGTGKTKTMQLFAEQLSAAGVPVFLADLKGDLSGLALPSEGEDFIEARMSGLAMPWQPAAAPVELLSLTGVGGSPLRVPVSSFGPLLLSKILDCTDVQASVLQVAFAYADDAGLALLDLEDLIALLRFLASDDPDADEAQRQYGGMSTQSLNVLLRKAMELESQGAETFFGEPEFDVEDLRRTVDGRGVITIMNLTDMQAQPRIFSTFMMWLLAEIYEQSPEAGEADRPNLVFFFDEAHLLFDGASKALVDAVERTVRLIRSKGVGVFFVTQQPTDLPDEVLGQLGNRVQHALRAFTPDDQKALKATAATFPVSEHYDIRECLTSLGTGEALITVLGPRGAPTAAVPTRLRAPASRMSPAPPGVLASLIASSPLAGKYAQELDRESAHEVLARRAAERAQAAQQAEEERLQAEREPVRAAPRRPSSRRKPMERAVGTAASAIGREVGRSLMRGLLGNLRR